VIRAPYPVFRKQQELSYDNDHFFHCAYLITFVILIGVMKKMFDRDAGQATAHLTQLAAEYAKREEEIKKQFEDIKRQGQEITANAQKDADQQKQRMLKEIEDEKAKIITQAQAKSDEMIQQADRARIALMNEIESKIRDKATEQAVSLLQQALPADVREKFHLFWVDNLIASSFQELDRLHIPEGTREATVRSAFPLTDLQRQALQATVKEKIGYALEFKEETDEKLIAGWEVAIGSLTLDGSLRFKIKNIAIQQQESSV